MIKIGTFTLSQSQKKKGYLLPNESGCATELTPHPDTGEENYEDVDDPIANPDDDTTYVYNDSTEVLKYDIYDLPAWTGNTSGTINDITVYSRGKGGVFVPPNAKYYILLLTDSEPCANHYVSDDKDITDTYKTFKYSWRENPLTSTDWTWDDLDDLQIGVKLQSSEYNFTKIRTIKTVSNGNYAEWIAQILGCDCDGTHYKHVNSEYHACGHPDETCYVYVIKYDWESPINYYDSNIFEDISTIEPTGTIEQITLTIQAQYLSPAPACGRPIFKGFLRIGGVNYYTDALPIENGVFTWQSHIWLTNPAGGSWTWSDVAAMEAGITVLLDCTTQISYCHVRDMSINVQYGVSNATPRICCTQTYAEVNYSETVECTLNKPEEISADHSRNVQMINFWNGSREVYDLSRSSKTMVLTGSEYQSDTCNRKCPCEHMTCIRTMGKEGSTVTISGLRSLFNGDYKIRSFGWKHVSKKPELYEWILELEDAS